MRTHSPSFAAKCPIYHELSCGKVLLADICSLVQENIMGARGFEAAGCNGIKSEPCYSKTSFPGFSSSTLSHIFIRMTYILLHLLLNHKSKIFSFYKQQNISLFLVLLMKSSWQAKMAIFSFDCFNYLKVQVVFRTSKMPHCRAPSTRSSCPITVVVFCKMK